MKLEEKLSELIKIETVSTWVEPNDFPKFREKIKEVFPVFFKNVELEVIQGSMLMKWKGKNSDNPILFMNHHDVVEATGKWKHDPFKGEIIDGKLWGRGTLDTKGGLFSMIEAAEELMIENYTPSSDIYFFSDSEEETTGNAASFVSEELKNRGIKFKYVLDEGGMIMYEPVGGAKGYYAMVGVGEKGCADIKFLAKSSGGHASTPKKNSPLVRLGKFMSEVDRKNLFKVELTDTLKEMFKRLSKTSSGAMKMFLGHPNLFGGLIKLIVPKLSETTNAMFRTTLAFTKAEGSQGYNVIPEVAYVAGNMRYSKHQGLESSMDEVIKIANKYDIEIEYVDKGIKSGVTDYRLDGFKFVEEAVSASYPGTYTAPYIMNGASDSRFFDKVSDQVLRFVPFIIDEEQLESIHGLNENVDVSCLEKAVNFYKYLMRK